MKRNRFPYFLFFIISLFIFSSCRRSFGNEEAMWRFLNDEKNGYKQEKTINGVTYSLLYKPTDLIVAQDVTDANPKKVEESRKKYRQNIYFTLTMSRNGQELLSNATGSREEFGAMVNQLAFEMDKKTHFFTPKKDTLELLDFIYPRMYGMSGNTSILFVYPRDQKYLKDEFLYFTIEDLGFYTGEVKFKVPVKIIKNEPRLKI